MKYLILSRLFLLITGLMTVNIVLAQKPENLQENNQGFSNDYDEEDILILGQYLKTSYCRHELSVWTTCGLSMLNYTVKTGKTDSGLGYSFGLGYTRFFNQRFGLSFGAEYAFYSKSLKIDQIRGANDTYDIAGNPIVYYWSVENYREKQQIGMINFPFAVLYQTGDNHKYYASLGFKIGLPVYGKFRSSDAILTTSGYYPDYDQNEIWQNDFGYGVFPVENKKELNFGFSLLGTFETGARWNIGIGKVLYMGIFMDYGFNNSFKYSNPSRFVEYNRYEPSQPVMNGFLDYQNGKVTPFAFGLRLRMAFSVGCYNLLKDRKTYKSLQSAHNNDKFIFIKH